MAASVAARVSASHGVPKPTKIASVGRVVGGEAPEAPSRGYQGKSEDSEEKDRVKEEVKKKLPTLQTLVIGGHYAPNCKFWCGSTTLGDVVVFESSAGSKKSSEPKSWDPVWQKYVGMFARFISVTKSKKNRLDSFFHSPSKP